MELTRRLFLEGVSGSGLAIAAPVAFLDGPAEKSARARLLLDRGWRFHLGHAADEAKDFGFGRYQRTFAKAGWGTADAARADFDDRAWAEISVPHDWAAGLPFAEPAGPVPAEQADMAAAHGFKAIGRDFPQNSVGWYRLALPIDPARRSGRYWLEFDGVFRDSIVFINNYVVAREESGYAPFTVDITDFLNDDAKPDFLAVRVDASLGEGWFYEGAGLYRDVHLVHAGDVHVAPWGVRVRAAVEGGRVDSAVELANRSAAVSAGLVRQKVFGPDGGIVATMPDAPFRLEVGRTAIVEALGAVPDAALWSCDAPNLYRLVTEIVIDGAVRDRCETRFGFRTTVFDPERGFLLNGKPLKLKGVCNHQDHAGVGSAIPPALEAWRIDRMREMGVNAWRSAHNPPSSSFLDLCDEKGVLVIDELRLNSTSAEAMDQLDRVVRRDRNHPCVMLWSVGNEEPQQGTARGARISGEMRAAIARLDGTRLVTQAFDNGFDSGAAKVVDVVGFNYRIDKIEAFHTRFPDRPVFASEAGSTVSTRGAYANDAAGHVVRAYDTEHPWWSSTAEEWWGIVADRPYIAGGFIWTGFDYRGEPTPYSAWPSVSSYFGVADLCGFPKDNYWYYRAWWRRDVPMVHLLPHWNWDKPGAPIEVWAHSNCDAVELRLNGRSLGRRDVVPNRHVAWSVPYAAGRIEAVGYRGGKPVARDGRETTGAGARFRLSADRQKLRGDARDISVLTLEALDAAGRAVPVADNAFALDVKGPGVVIGLGNGDPNDHGLGTGSGRLFNGLAQILVRATAPGTVLVSARGEGMRAAELALLGT